MILLVNAPYFRLVGSHNDRAPLSLCYMSAYLEKAQIEHRVFNSEYTGAEAYWRWKALGRHFDLFRQGIDGNSPVYMDLAERIMSYRPKAVVIGIGDPILASVGLGNAWGGYWLARALKEAGCEKVYGFGQYVTLDADHWLDKPGAYDGVLIGEPSDDIVAIANAVAAGHAPSGKVQMKGFGCDILPNFRRLVPEGQKNDIVMSSIGCAWRCTFCLAPKVTGNFKFIDPKLVAKDFFDRPGKKLFWGDMVFTVKIPHLRALADALDAEQAERSHNSITRGGMPVVRPESVCEARVDTLDDERCALLKRIGVIGCKIGIETLDPEHLVGLNKKIVPEQMDAAVAMLRKHGLKFIAYVMLGGKNSSNDTAQKTYDWLVEKEVDYTIVSTYSDDGLGSAADAGKSREFRYDAHFSPDCLGRWNISPEWLDKFNGLQKDRGVAKMSQVIG